MNIDPKSLNPSPGLDDVPTLLHLAQSLHRSNKSDEAGDYYRKILVIDPGNPDALHMLGIVEQTAGALDHAIPLIKRAIAIAPDELKWYNLGGCYQMMGNIPGSVLAYRQAINRNPGYLAAAQNLIFALDLHWAASPSMLLAERRAFNARFCAPYTQQAKPHEGISLDPNRPLKIGYVSGDFKTHSASRAITPFLFSHDAKNFEVYFFSTNPDLDPAKDLQTAEYHRIARERPGYVWCDVGGLPDQMLADMIRQHGIDILIDLSGFSGLNRLQMFARRPAPIQMTGWGYATGVGMDAIDYLVSDPICIPPDHEHYYHEKIARVPTLLTYDPAQPTPDIATLPFTTNHYPTFGYIGRAAKITEPTLIAWADIMRRVPDAKLILKGEEYKQSFFRERIMDLLVSMGVHERRVAMLVGTNHYDHIATYNSIDVALDTWPIGSGVTALDATFMGVPTVTKLGELVPARLATSILSQVGLAPEGHRNTTVEDYVHQAVQWANDIPFLDHCRRTLRGRMQKSIIMDGEQYCRRWERTLRDIWRQYCSERRKEIGLS